MSSYRDEENDNVETLLGLRQTQRPDLDDTKRFNQAGVPETIAVVMPDGVELKLKTTQDIIIGRRPRAEDPPVTVDLQHYDAHRMGVSRHHAMLKVSKGTLILVDMGSVNGTFVNGHRARPANRYAVYHGDEIRVGRITLLLKFDFES